MYTLIIDTHIHLYRKFDLSLLLKSACENMRTYFSSSQLSGTLLPVLGLTSTPSETSWRELSEIQVSGAAIDGKGGEWQLSQTGDDTLFRASNPMGDDVYLLRGHQLITSEKLELLVLGSESPAYDAERGLMWHVENNLSELMIIPWAVGKWLGPRGAIVSEVMDRYSDSIHLGDNGGRPAIWSHVKQFKEAAHSKAAIWPGTDPLPLPGQECTVGLNTITVEGVKLGTLSGKDLVASLATNNSSIITQARRENLFGFFYNQLRLRLPVN
ncbi:MAG: hypothetical protein ACR2P1_05140 [Pseudomonadales bacterium]